LFAGRFAFIRSRQAATVTLTMSLGWPMGASFKMPCA
jgi:hypothetical protein